MVNFRALTKVVGKLKSVAPEEEELIPLVTNLARREGYQFSSENNIIGGVKFDLSKASEKFQNDILKKLDPNLKDSELINLGDKGRSALFTKLGGVAALAALGLGVRSSKTGEYTLEQIEEQKESTINEPSGELDPPAPPPKPEFPSAVRFADNSEKISESIITTSTKIQTEATKVFEDEEYRGAATKLLDEVKTITNLFKDQVTTAQADADKERISNQWGEVANLIGNALVQLSVGIYQAKTGKPVNGVQLNLIDWGGKMKQISQNMRDKIDNYEKQFGVSRGEIKGRQLDAKEKEQIARMKFETKKAADIEKIRMDGNAEVQKLKSEEEAKNRQIIQDYNNAVQKFMVDLEEEKLNVRQVQQQIKEAQKVAVRQQIQDEKKFQAFLAEGAKLDREINLYNNKDTPSQKKPEVQANIQRSLTSMAINLGIPAPEIEELITKGGLFKKDKINFNSSIIMDMLIKLKMGGTPE